MRKLIKITSVFVLLVIVAATLWGNFAKSLFPFEYKLEISKGAAMYNLDAYLVASVVKTESGFDENASSGVAHGLMQLTDETAQFVSERTDFHYEKRLEPETNILMGCYYLSYLKDKFDDIDLALAAYNAGPATVERWLGDSRYSADGKVLDNIPYRETRHYLRKVKLFYRIYKRIYEIS